jgi:hypothetical protein
MEAHILEARHPGRADRAAVDQGRAHADEEQPSMDRSHRMIAS